MRLIKFVTKYRKVFRGALYPSAAGIVGLLLAFQTNEVYVQLSLSVVVVMSWLFLIAIVELLIIRGMSGQKYFSTQNELFKQISLFEQIRMSTSVDLLGGTFASFTYDGENLLGLRELLTRQGQLRILMLDPFGSGIHAYSEARCVRIPSFDHDQKLKQEVKNSLSRFIEQLGEAETLKVVRLYGVAPTSSIYRFDDKVVLTSYTYGRGASSPAVLLYRDEHNNDYFDHLLRGFNELWEAAGKLDKQELDRALNA